MVAHGLRADRGLVVGEGTPKHLRIHRSERQAIAADTTLPELLGEALRHTGKCRLARTICHQPGELGAILKASHAADMDHMPGRITIEFIHQGLCDQQWREDIHTKERIERISSVASDGRLVQQAGIVHHCVHAPAGHALLDACSCRCHGQVQHAGFNEAPTLPGQCVQGLRITCDGDHATAFHEGQPQYRGLSHPPARPRNYDKAFHLLYTGHGPLLRGPTFVPAHWVRGIPRPSKLPGMNDPSLDTLFLGNPLSHWLAALAWACGAWVLGRSLSWASSNSLKRLASRTATRLDDILVGALRGPLVAIITLFGVYLAFQQLELPERMDQWVDRIIKVATVLALTWLLARLMDALVEEFLVPRARRDETVVVSNELVPVMRSATKVLVWGLGLVLALNNAGYNVGALLAGIGIGGLAMAMAAKDTVANIFGGVTVFTDKPFMVGDRIRIAGYDGFVEEVGIRSTRIRTLEGPVVVVPNFKFTDSVLENVSHQATFRVRHELGLVYETPTEKIEAALAILNTLVDEHADVLMPERMVSFTTFKAYSLNILFIYFIRKEADIFATRSRIHLELMKRFSAAGLEFAYPTQVEYSKGG